jgi:hypothetical protein
MGQKRAVIAERLMIRGSIEDRMDQIQRKKSNLASMSLKKLSRKELMEQKVSLGYGAVASGRATDLQANDIAELFR